MPRERSAGGGRRHMQQVEPEPVYRLRRCDEEHGQMSCSESNDQPVLGPFRNKIANGRFEVRQRLILTERFNKSF